MLGASMFAAAIVDDQTSWMMLVPNRVLLMAMPWSSSSTQSLPRELNTRLARRELSESQIEDLLDLSFGGDADALPGSAAWRSKYAEGVIIYMRMLANPSVLDDRLLAIPVNPTVTGPAKWSADVPLCLSLQVDGIWWPEWADIRLTAVVSDGAGVPLRSPLRTLPAKRCGDVDAVSHCG